uniref:Uncharacterized protein ycf23 n=1 Tax=Dipterosiphonia australica TaxID=2007208 RepID=A0A1Z1MLH8_9FLOR|nr:hypothetical protein [Dipterosiphonia australica]ARW66786.1 hypothetical protein [Dipterosiphonia australica]
MNLSNIQLHKSFKDKNVIKVITGIQNTNISQIHKIAKAAELAEASYLDIVANTKIVNFLKSFSPLPLCISSIDPIDIYNCVSMGADLVELGNYDYFYGRGIYLTPSHLIALVKEIKLLIGNIDICVTIPYYLDLSEQINLAQNLESIGVNLLQTEGLFLNNSSKDLSSFINGLSPSLLSTHYISKYVDIPLLTSSGMTSLYSPMATYCGASGIGISSAIKKKSNIIDMVKYIIDIKNSMMINKNIQQKEIDSILYTSFYNDVEKVVPSM